MKTQKIKKISINNNNVIHVGDEINFLCDIKTEGETWNLAYGNDVDAFAGSKGKIIDISKTGKMISISIKYFSSKLKNYNIQIVPSLWFDTNAGIFKIIRK